MKVLVTAATQKELNSVFLHLNNAEEGETYVSKYNDIEIYALISGVGMVSTSYYLGKILNSEKFDCAVNIGIAGLLHGGYKKGSTFIIKNEYFPEFGSGEGDNFISAYQKGLISPDKFPFDKGLLKCNMIKNKYVSGMNNYANGITVNRCQAVTDEVLPGELLELPVVETMESAAFFYCCLQNNLPFIALRSISNYTYETNRNDWKIEEAIANLHNNLKELLNAF